MATARVIRQTVKVRDTRTGQMEDQPLLEDWMVDYGGSEMANPRIQDRILEAFSGLRSVAADKKIGVGAEIAIRPFMVSDIPAAGGGVTNLYGAAGHWLTTALTASATVYTTTVNFQLNSAQALCFLSFFDWDTTPTVSAVRYGLGNGGTAVKCQYGTEYLLTEEDQNLWHSPVYYLPDEWVPLQVLAAAAVTEQCGYRAFIVEKQGSVVQGIQV